MGRYRIGNTLTIEWEVKKNGASLPLSGRTVKLYMTHPRGREECTGFEINGSKLTYVFDGLDQKVLGKYTLTVDVRGADKKRILITDKCGAFTLVGASCAEQLEDDYTIRL